MEKICFWSKYLYYYLGENSVERDKVESFMDDIRSSRMPIAMLQMYQSSGDTKEMYFNDIVQAQNINRDFVGRCLTKTRENIEKRVSFENIDRSFFEDHLFDYLFFQRVFARQYDSCLEEEKFKEDGPIQSFQIVDKIAEKTLRRLEEAFKKDLREGRGLKNFVYFKPSEVKLLISSSITAVGFCILIAIGRNGIPKIMHKNT